MEQTEFDVIERVLERDEISAEELLAGMMRAMIDAYAAALARNPSPCRPSGEARDDETYDRALEDLQAIAMWQNAENADLADRHERDAAQAANEGDAVRSRVLAKVYGRLALAQLAMGELLDGCHDLAMLKAGLQPVLGTLPHEPATPPAADDDQPRLRLAV